MLKQALIPICLLVIAGMLSGCIGGGEAGVVTGTNGIIIKDFGFDYTPIYAEEQVGLSMEVQNVGGEEGTITGITIFGADAATSCPGGELQWCNAGTRGMEETLSVDLLPPDPSTGMEGQEDFYDWLLEAPSAVRAPTTYDFEVRLDYTYSTVYTGTLQLVEQDYLQTLAPADREALIKAGGVVDAFTTAGPLSLTAASGRHFIYRSGTAPEARDIKFRVTNVGSGFPYNGDKSTGNLYTVRITGSIGVTCSDTTKTLSRGKTAVITCTFDPGSVTFTNKMERQFQITLEYEYYVDSAASITVNPVFD